MLRGGPVKPVVSTCSITQLRVVVTFKLPCAMDYDIVKNVRLLAYIGVLKMDNTQQDNVIASPKATIAMLLEQRKWAEAITVIIGARTVCEDKAETLVLMYQQAKANFGLGEWRKAFILADIVAYEYFKMLATLSPEQEARHFAARALGLLARTRHNRLDNGKLCQLYGGILRQEIKAAILLRLLPDDITELNDLLSQLEA